MSRKSAGIDLLIMAVVIMGTWSLRFLEVGKVGPLTMAVALVAVGLLLRHRHQTAAVIHLLPLPPFRAVLRDAFKLLAWFGLTILVVGALIILTLGQPETASAVSEQPQALWAFLLDITLVLWVLIAFGEEVVFRGFILNRLLTLTRGLRAAVPIACAVQGIWFGALHASQGLSGMILTGAIGFVFAGFLLTRQRPSLWPLILVHGAVDTVSLTLAYVLA